MKANFKLVTAAVLLAIAGLVGGCKKLDQQGVTKAEVYIFPKFKHTTELDFSLSTDERKAAVRESRRRRANLLCELVIDREGIVQNIRVICGLEGGEDEDFFTKGFMKRIQNYRFEPSTRKAPYRTFFYPLTIKRKTDCM
jgi:hypothetical protein